MKTAKTKTRYFKKDYAPARAMAARRRSQTVSGKVVKKLKQVTNSTKRTAKRTTKVSPASATRKTTYARNKSTSTTKTSRNTKSTRTSKSLLKLSGLSWPEITLLSIIGTSAVVILFTFAFAAIFDPVKRSERELNKLADAYYVEYLYPRALGGKFNEAENILKDFTSQGLPNVRLRQLLLFNEAKYASSASAFSNEYYECDTNKTYVRYYPTAPYGPRDYTVYYGTSCEKVGYAN